MKAIDKNSDAYIEGVTKEAKAIKAEMRQSEKLSIYSELFSNLENSEALHGVAALMFISKGSQQRLDQVMEFVPTKQAFDAANSIAKLELQIEHRFIDLAESKLEKMREDAEDIAIQQRLDDKKQGGL